MMTKPSQNRDNLLLKNVCFLFSMKEILNVSNDHHNQQQQTNLIHKKTTTANDRKLRFDLEHTHMHPVVFVHVVLGPHKSGHIHVLY